MLKSAKCSLTVFMKLFWVFVTFWLSRLSLIFWTVVKLQLQDVYFGQNTPTHTSHSPSSYFQKTCVLYIYQSTYLPWPYRMYSWMRNRYEWCLISSTVRLSRNRGVCVRLCVDWIGRSHSTSCLIYATHDGFCVASVCKTKFC